MLIIVENLSVPFDRRVWRECLALREAGYSISVISPVGIGVDTKRRETIDGVDIFRFPTLHAQGSFLSYMVEYGIALIMSFWLMWVVLLRRGFDVIQICNPPDLLILPALPFKLLGKKVIFDQHDLSPEIYQTQKRLAGRLDAVTRVLLFLERLTYRYSDVVMVVNESCKRIAQGRGAKTPEEVFVVRNGPSLKNLQSAHADPALKEGKRLLLVYVGLMGPQEGIDVLLRAILALRTAHRRNDFHVRIMGGGTVLEQMKQYAVQLGIDDVVTFAGHVSYTQVMQGIASADLCLCPDPKTPLSDKCSLVKAVEYMSLGRAFVAFDLEEVHSFAADAALYANANDEDDFAQKVATLMDDEERRASMGAIGRERFMQQLTWEHSKHALYAAYEQAFRLRAEGIERRAG